jgi:hypothetical protein
MGMKHVRFSGVLQELLIVRRSSAAGPTIRSGKQRETEENAIDKYAGLYSHLEFVQYPTDMPPIIWTTWTEE